jgi:hypothetical protein
LDQSIVPASPLASAEVDPVLGEILERALETVADSSPVVARYE